MQNNRCFTLLNMQICDVLVEGSFGINGENVNGKATNQEFDWSSEEK